MVWSCQITSDYLLNTYKHADVVLCWRACLQSECQAMLILMPKPRRIGAPWENRPIRRLTNIVNADPCHLTQMAHLSVCVPVVMMEIRQMGQLTKMFWQNVEWCNWWPFGWLKRGNWGVGGRPSWICKEVIGITKVQLFWDELDMPQSGHLCLAACCQHAYYICIGGGQVAKKPTMLLWSPFRYTPWGIAIV